MWPTSDKTLPPSFDLLRASKTFFETSNIDAGFFDVPFEAWSDTFLTITKDEEQKQFLFQVVEKHRKNFTEYNRELLAKI